MQNFSYHKINFFTQAILAFYREQGRTHLPWRREGISVYEVWVSEIMLQQTQVDRVIEYYNRFLERFPTIQDLAKTTWEEFLPYYQGLGYYRRGRNMLEVAHKVAHEYDGEFPCDINELQKFPGIGPYTACAIVSFAFGKNCLAWDTNFARVFGRFFFGSKEASFDSLVFEKRIQENKRDFNGAVMDFGSIVCVRKPRCEGCPLREKCVYFRERGKGEYQIRTRLIAPLQHSVIMQTILILHENHKVYFSLNKAMYKPFILPDGVVSRSDIKQFFEKKYGLHLAVRPPKEKFFYKKKPTQLVYAQILLGEYSFGTFQRRSVDAVLAKILKNV